MFLTGFILCLKNVCAIPYGFIKMFPLQQSRCLRFSMVQQFLSCLQGSFYSFDQKKVPFLLIYLLPTHKKCNHKMNHTYFNLVYSVCQREDIYSLVKLLTSSFCYYFFNDYYYFINDLFKISTVFINEH